ncbi:MAG TPA: SOS response-associated peptidase [Solirubrobacteraceae bacterium]|jgi:putative SOS response-associated peptidase YedK|nr:SOS response-associated peptidase [Solirubrobacteraceae bacterium]
MCGRYTLSTTTPADVAGRFGLAGAPLPAEALGRANVCPTEDVLAVVADPGGVRRPAMLRWGLAPSWATLKGMRPLINARDDKLRSSGAWRSLAGEATHRCLVVADGWLEWQRAEDPRQPRQPFLHRLRGGEPFAFAGLWCVARPKDAPGEIASCTIVTVPASREAARLHDRMPAVLAGDDDQAAWLHGEVGLDGAIDLVRPLPDGSLEIAPVSPALNGAGNGADQLSLLASAP